MKKLTIEQKVGLLEQVFESKKLEKTELGYNFIYTIDLIEILNANTEKELILTRACPECESDMEEGLYNQWECMSCRYAEVAE